MKLCDTSNLLLLFISMALHGDNMCKYHTDRFRHSTKDDRLGTKMRLADRFVCSYTLYSLLVTTRHTGRKETGERERLSGGLYIITKSSSSGL